MNNKDEKILKSKKENKEIKTTEKEGGGGVKSFLKGAFLVTCIAMEKISKD